MTEKKVSRKRKAPEGVVGRIEDVVSQPIAVANKAFLASLGLVTQLQKDLDSKYEELAKDGKKARDRYEATLTDLRKKIAARVASVRDRAGSRIEPVVDRIIEMTPVATEKDINRLNKKLDKVLAQVAK
ncbi:MAG: phasin family protein [Gammaproteobacteria bacterium]|nr:phasin family protein [Gammaproteobacteria bacterium]MDH3373829.1 phasin family protein [Gammaproteobacteria bacterium]MDH3410563.1 phasin family protein [Gammaproteobacteria bacterium]MDH3551964.1 phasin family protein [Gammaproteobacteria bacterium]